MINQKINKLCAYQFFDGLREGLSKYAGTSRVALIYTSRPTEPMFIFDPQHLLKGHEPKLKQIYIDSDAWKKDALVIQSMSANDQPFPEPNLQLTGLITYGGKSSQLFYQMWFTEHHPDLCHEGPIERWLEHAVWLLANNVKSTNASIAETSGRMLREYATHAVRDFIVDELNYSLGMDIQLRIYPILDAILAISRTLEEGQWPEGQISFIEPRFIANMFMLARFPSNAQPNLLHYRHVRKLLQAVEKSDRKLISDGRSIVGIANGQLPLVRLTADFRKRHGFMRLKGKRICSFSDGNFHGSSRKVNLVQLEELLLEMDLSCDPHELYKTICEIVHHAEDHKHGCTLVIDMNDPSLSLPGQYMETALDLTDPNYLDLAKSFAKLDGALHICKDNKLYGFACILDGNNVAGEDRARGARFNSAIRFTAQNNHIIVVVVSTDRPVSLIQSGVELNAQCTWKFMPSCLPLSPTLEEWLK